MDLAGMVKFLHMRGYLTRVEPQKITERPLIFARRW
jgi:hypothetical protein